MTDLNEQQLRRLHLMGVRVWQEQGKAAQRKSVRDASNARAALPLDGANTAQQSERATQPIQGRQSAPTAASTEPEVFAPAPDVAALDWSQLESIVAACRSCSLSKTRTQTVFGVGQQRSDWMFIGEAPGAEEDRRGQPFVGRAGQLLDAMLAAINLSRDNVFIANVLKCRPPGNRDPQVEEVNQCSGYLRRQIELVQPKLIVAVGRIAAQKLLNSNASLARMRGKLHHYKDMNIPVLVTYHPAYLLRAPAQKRQAWEDLLMAASLVDSDANSAANPTSNEDHSE